VYNKRASSVFKYYMYSTLLVECQPRDTYSSEVTYPHFPPFRKTRGNAIEMGHENAAVFKGSDSRRPKAARRSWWTVNLPPVHVTYTYIRALTPVGYMTPPPTRIRDYHYVPTYSGDHLLE